MYISSLWRLLLNFSRSCIALCSAHFATAVTCAELFQVLHRSPFIAFCLRRFCRCASFRSCITLCSAHFATAVTCAELFQVLHRSPFIASCLSRFCRCASFRSCIALCSSHPASAVFAAVIHLAPSSYSATARYPSLCLNEVRSK